METTKDVELVNRWLEHQERERGRSTQTLYSYSRDASRLLSYLSSRHQSLRTVSTVDLRDWVHEPLSKGRVGEAPSTSSVKRKVSTLRSLFSFLHAEGLVDANPSGRLFAPRVDNENPNPVDLSTWRILWRSDLDDADRVAFGLGLFCGLRRSEVVAISEENFEGKMLSGFRRKGGKLGSVPWQSCVQFFAEHDPSLLGGDINSFVQPLARLRTARPGPGPLVPYRDAPHRTCTTTLSGGRVDPQFMNRRLGRALRAAGLDEQRFTPHQLRHTFCTLLVEWGVPLLVVSRLAGHANVTVTQRYTKTKEDPLSDLLGNGVGEGVMTFDRI